ncbi:hypothetical protein GOP47_0013615 [Adiantum capillus-veneris]|uniref:Uncharacterized protein n=1 Tax=Adiantum capillus-veneris TaxID=13818 RepID=A0A9D4ZDK1_ADICA|nr:hypothetical protein GOP47_0013615 [Adiantum capillus-veneris]
MDSSSFPPPALAAQGVRSYRSKPSLPAAAVAAVSSSKPRKSPATAGSRHFPKTTLKIPSPPQLKHSDKRAETDNLHIRQNGQDAQQAVQDSENPLLKIKETMAVLKVEASCECMPIAELRAEIVNKEVDQTGMEQNNALGEDAIHAEDDTMRRSRQVVPNHGVLIIEGKAAITASGKDEASEKAGDQNINPSTQENEQNPAGLHENELKDSPQIYECQVQSMNSCTGEESCKVGCEELSSATEAYSGPEQADPGELKGLAERVSELDCQILFPERDRACESFKNLSATFPQRASSTSPLTETKALVYGEKSTPRSSAGLKKDSEYDVQQISEDSLLLTSEHLDNEQEGFVFAKGEALIRETVQSSDSLKAGVDASTAKQFTEQDLTSLSQFEAVLIAASDFKATASSASKSAGGNSTTCSLPSAELMEAAVVALAKVDVLEAKLSLMAHDQIKKTFFCMLRPPKLAMKVRILSLAIPLLGGLFYFVLTAIQDGQQPYLHPT